MASSASPDAAPPGAGASNPNAVPSLKRHIAHASDEWVAYAVEPDYCRVGGNIIPFKSYARLGNPIKASPNVFVRGSPVYRIGDMHQIVKSDAGSHIVAGTSLESGCVKFLTGQDNVRANDIPVVRRDSECLVNCNAAGKGGAKGKVVTEIKASSNDFVRWASQWSDKLYIEPGPFKKAWDAAVAGASDPGNTWFQRGIFAIGGAGVALPAGAEDLLRGMANTPSSLLGTVPELSQAGSQFGLTADTALDGNERIIAGLEGTKLSALALLTILGSLQPIKPSLGKLESAAAKTTVEEETAAGAGLFIKQRLRTLKELEGKTEGGPGTWGKSPRRTAGEEYQEQITGVQRGVEYNVDGVWFDGYDAQRGVLLDAKDWAGFPPADTRFWQEGVVREATGQLTAAPGTPIEWVFSTQSGADAAATALHEDEIFDITTVVVPKQ